MSQQPQFPELTAVNVAKGFAEGRRYIPPRIIGGSTKDGRAYDRFSGPPRHEVIGTPLWVKVLDVVSCGMVLAAVGAMLAIGGAF